MSLSIMCSPGLAGPLLAAAALGCSIGGATAQQPTGVASCDAFLTKYDVCIKTKVPAEHQAQFNQMASMLRSSIAPMASSAPTQAEAACRQIEDVVKQKAAPMGCAW